MIDTLRDSLATQGQIADTLRDALPVLSIVTALLVVVVLLLIMLIAAQRQTISAAQNILAYMSDIYRTLGNLDFRTTVTRRTRQRRKFHKRRKRRKIK